MTTQPEALRLADEWLRKTRSEADRRNSAYDHYGMGNTPENVDPLGAKMVAELRRLHALCAEWEIKATAWLASPEAAKRLEGYRSLAERAANAETQRDALLEALKLAWPIIEKEKFMQDGCYGKNFIQSKAERARKACEAARAAIAAVEETK